MRRAQLHLQLHLRNVTAKDKEHWSKLRLGGATAACHCCPCWGSHSRRKGFACSLVFLVLLPHKKNVQKHVWNKRRAARAKEGKGGNLLKWRGDNLSSCNGFAVTSGFEYWSPSGCLQQSLVSHNYRATKLQSCTAGAQQPPAHLHNGAALLLYHAYAASPAASLETAAFRAFFQVHSGIQ